MSFRDAVLLGIVAGFLASAAFYITTLLIQAALQ